MGEREHHAPGTFSWADLGTTDADAAKAFYGALFGWTFEDRPGGTDGVYVLAVKDGREVAGLFAEPQERPHWNSYVAVASADEAVERAAALGATVVEPALDAGEAGRMAVLRDPTGAHVCVWEARRHPGAALVNTPGSLTWNDLTTRDVEAAKRFYAAWMGWVMEEMPGSGGYHVIRNGERSNGGMQPMRPEMGEAVPSNWIPYFGTEDVDAALGRVAELGGGVLAGPIRMPAGSIAVVADPQGAPFALWSGEYDED